MFSRAVEASSPLWQTPSSITAPKVRSDKSESSPTVSVPVALGKYEAKDLEESERERGNAAFKAGNFSAAVKCYTKCLGLKARNYVAFSNRAMAYLKLKEYARAVVSSTALFFICGVTVLTTVAAVHHCVADGLYLRLANRSHSCEVPIAPQHSVQRPRQAPGRPT